MYLAKYVICAWYWTNNICIKGLPICFLEFLDVALISPAFSVSLSRLVSTVYMWRIKSGHLSRLKPPVPDSITWVVSSLKRTMQSEHHQEALACPKLSGNYRSICVCDSAEISTEMVQSYSADIDYTHLFKGYLHVLGKKSISMGKKRRLWITCCRCIVYRVNGNFLLQVSCNSGFNFQLHCTRSTVKRIDSSLHSAKES